MKNWQEFLENMNSASKHFNGGIIIEKVGFNTTYVFHMENVIAYLIDELPWCPYYNTKCKFTDVEEQRMIDIKDFFPTR